MSEQQNDAIFEELDLLFTEDAFWVSKSIEKRLTIREIEWLKNIVELARKAEREIIQSFYKNYLTQENNVMDVSYPIPLTKENRKEYQWLINTASFLIICRNDTSHEDIKKAVLMLRSDENLPNYDLIIQFKRPSKEKDFFLKRVYVQKKEEAIKYQ